ncbi:MAG: hypothetical protein KC549_09840 [Myxococcales bacterium]|nr:hypothetical protein [Myxococcales bacterium]
MTVRFHEALANAQAFLAQHAGFGARRLLVRDLKGRLRVFLTDKVDLATWTRGLNQQSRQERDRLAPALHASLGAWSYNEAVVLQDAAVLADFNAAWDDPDARPLDATTHFLERGVIGADWLRTPLPNRPPAPPRATLFGLKGGVGRSTALAVWARFLSENKGLRVLVVDLDLDAPGVGSMLLPSADHPDFGVVDWFVERAVGQTDGLAADLAATSPLTAGDGQITVVPAAGLKTGLYLPKLARVYQGDHINGADVGFGGLVAELVDDLEAHWQPDVVLLDSRSGLHDVGAVALTRLHALGLLFAVDTPQTWAGYAHLVAPWRDAAMWRSDRLLPVRRNLQVVAGQVPERDRDRYLARLRANAYDTFLPLYDEEADAVLAAPDLLAFGPDDEAAPHYATPIYWSAVLADWDPVHRPDAVTAEQIEGAFGSFLERATELLGLS